MGDYQKIIEALEKEIRVCRETIARFHGGDYAEGIVEGLDNSKRLVIKMMEGEMEDMGKFYESEWRPDTTGSDKTNPT